MGKSASNTSQAYSKSTCASLCPSNSETQMANASGSWAWVCATVSTLAFGIAWAAGQRM